jgi:hypothetical protein
MSHPSQGFIGELSSDPSSPIRRSPLSPFLLGRGLTDRSRHVRAIPVAEAAWPSTPRTSIPAAGLGRGPRQLLTAMPVAAAISW